MSICPARPLTRRRLLADGARLALPVLAPLVKAQTASTRPPNIVFIMADDLGYADLSCYGRPDYSTPNIDRVAREGVRFTQFYCNSPVCSASRTALMTGRYQHRLPVGLEEPLSYARRDLGLPPDHPTLPSLLRDAGYGTALVGKWHLGWLPKYGPQQSGYDQFWGIRGGAADYFTHSDDLWDNDTKITQPGYLTDLIGDKAVSTIRQFGERRAPFFLSVHFTAPHWPWQGPEDAAAASQPSNLFDISGGSQSKYGRIVQRMDMQVGRILGALNTSRLSENTLVIFTSDNGGERFSNVWPFHGMKTELLEGGLRIPALVRWPARIKGGGKCDQVGITMDWLPTLLSVAATKPATSHPPDGIDLSPYLVGSKTPVNRTLFWRYRRNGQHAVRAGNNKLLKIGSNSFLFDVVADPQERANHRETDPQLFARLSQAWQAWNAKMLPDDPAALSHGFTSAQFADHYAPEQ